MSLEGSLANLDKFNTFFIKGAQKINVNRLAKQQTKNLGRQQSVESVGELQYESIFTETVGDVAQF